MKFARIIAGVVIALLAPLAASAAITSGPLYDFVQEIKTIFDFAVGLIIGLAFVVFLWGIFKYVYTASLEGKEGARQTIIYGLIGLFVMLAVWGLVKILVGTFFSSSDLTAPTQGELPKPF